MTRLPRILESGQDQHFCAIVVGVFSCNIPKTLLITPNLVPVAKGPCIRSRGRKFAPRLLVSRLYISALIAI